MSSENRSKTMADEAKEIIERTRPESGRPWCNEVCTQSIVRREKYNSARKWYVKKLELIELLKDNGTNTNQNPKL